MPELSTARSRLRAAVAIAGALCAAFARADESSAGLAVSAIPPVLSPGERRVTVRVEGCPDVAALATSAGSIANVRAVAPGVTVADYLPPPEARPQIAFVVADCGDRHGFTPLPIVGRGTALARTEPGASVRVTIGARSFGPVAADEDGLARVPVEVAPGVRFAYQGERPLDLRVPPAPLVHLVLDPPSGLADRETSIAVRAYLATDGGAPRPAAPLRLAPEEGTLSDVAETAPGLVTARWTLPAGRAGTIALRASIDGDASPEAAAPLLRRAGPPARVEAAPDRAVAVAGEAPLQLDVRIVDAAGNLTAAPLRVEPPEAVLDVRELEPGRWTVGLDVPERLGGREALELSIAAGASGEAGGAARVPLAAAPPVALEVEAPPRRELVADGDEALAVTVTQVDRFGNPALEPPPAAETEAPAEISTVREGDVFRVKVRPRRRLAPGEDALVIRGAGRTERLPLALLPAEPWLVLGARVGYLGSAGGLRSAYGAIEAAWWPVAWRRFGLALEAGAFSLDRSDAVLLGSEELEVRGRVRYLPVVGSARWRVAPSPRSVLLAGAGAVLAPLSAEVGVSGQPALRENGVAPGAQVAFGAGRRLGAGLLFLEARGLWLADPGLDAVRGRVLATGLVAGWAHGLL